MRSHACTSDEIHGVERILRSGLVSGGNDSQTGISKGVGSCGAVILTFEAMGGRISLVAEFPDREPVLLSGIAAIDT
jgi:hypothetical protein